MGSSHSNLVAGPQGTNVPGAARRWKRLGLALVVVLSLILLALGGFVVNIIFIKHNFHTVSPGQVYRSAQLDADGLTRTVQEHGIKSILNLRGGARNGGSAWYSAETNAAASLGVQYFDYELSASEELTETQMEELVSIVGKAPKPLLIHCKSGADRTGLVGALYLYNFEGKSAAAAAGELTMFYGHVPYLFWQDTVAMDHSFSRYVSSHAPAVGVKSKKLASPLTRQESAALPLAN